MCETVLLSVDEMYKADAAAESGGIASIDLMEAAGACVVKEIVKRWSPQPIAILCGPGNNGGDGFVVARHLSEAGWPVHLALLGDVESLKGDAATNAKRWTGIIAPLNRAVLEGCDLVVDALFGAGLTRALEGVVLDLAQVVNQSSCKCISIDMPSGVHGDSGQVLGAAFKATLTVTFFRRKPGHLLLPGRNHCGELVVTDIGIPSSVLDEINPQTFANGPSLWEKKFPWPRADSHKYTRGHGVVVGGAEMTGAARLASTAARRVGCGLVTIAAPSKAIPIYAAGLPGTLFKALDDQGAFADLLADDRKNAVLVGPGAGVHEATKLLSLSALNGGKSTVLDADALTVFAEAPQELFQAIKAPTVLTPHEGEFVRLFNRGDDKLSDVRAAAKVSGAVVLLKGADTVIAHPDGKAVICANGPPELATAGSGDVLAGLIMGLLAQGMDDFDAACSGTWFLGVSAQKFGPGLIAEDIAEMLPKVLRDLRGL